MIDAEKITDVHVFAILQQELTKAHAQSPNCTRRVMAKFILPIKKYLLTVHQSVFKTSLHYFTVHDHYNIFQFLIRKHILILIFKMSLFSDIAGKNCDFEL
jgi:hypothetical protein